MSATSLTDTQGIVALGALGVALLALIACTMLARGVRRLRGAQKLVLGNSSEQDLIAHSASLQEARAKSAATLTAARAKRNRGALCRLVTFKLANAPYRGRAAGAPEKRRVAKHVILFSAVMRASNNN